MGPVSRQKMLVRAVRRHWQRTAGVVPVCLNWPTGLADADQAPNDVSSDHEPILARSSEASGTSSTPNPRGLAELLSRRGHSAGTHR